jgi:heme/copper-type cytochrome/quinol oxidase subunit 2
MVWGYVVLCFLGLIVALALVGSVFRCKFRKEEHPKDWPSNFSH